ncbi:MAG TPA: hypothetical protein VEZ48_07010 [Sphingomonadaceae bacterium]|nr:hypothetical protein [Sphingomonadaceae bacterium]
MKVVLPLLVLATAAPAAVHREPPVAVRAEARVQRAAPVRVAQRADAPALPTAPLVPPPAPEPAPPEIKGQNEAAYDNLLARDPGTKARVLGFESFLKNEGLADVLPTWQLTRTASDYEKCGGPGFEVAPIEEWQHIADTLRFIKRHVEPVIGDVEAMSGYRNPELNACAGGAKESAHRRFFALDLVPERPIARQGLIRSICAIHEFRGRAYDIGLGFYNGLRFHIDSKGFRKWGPNGKGVTSPCVTGI